MTPGIWGVSITDMRRALTFLMAWMILTACVVCPLVQAFDRWDHEIQTGHDSESVFVVLTVCLGALLVLARAVPLLNAIPARTISAVLSLVPSSHALGSVSPATFLSASPPSAVLRI